MAEILPFAEHLASVIDLGGSVAWTKLFEGVGNRHGIVKEPMTPPSAFMRTILYHLTDNKIAFQEITAIAKHLPTPE